MKKRAVCLMMVLMLVLSLSATALAASTDNGKATITDPITGATVTFAEDNEEKINVTYTSNLVKEGGQYLILMVKGDKGSYEITESSILYIDQAQGDSANTLTFTVYPSNLEDSVILITGVDNGPLIAAIVNAKYILGDVNGDGLVNSDDAVLVLQYVVGLVNAEDDGINLAAGDVNSADGINSDDAVLILQLVVGIVGSDFKPVG